MTSDEAPRSARQSRAPEANAITPSLNEQREQQRVIMDKVFELSNRESEERKLNEQLRAEQEERERSAQVGCTHTHAHDWFSVPSLASESNFE